MFRISALAMMAAGLAACQTALPDPAGPAAVKGRADAPPGTCWARDDTPAVVETVTEQIQVQPAVTAADGTVTQPAIYRTETRQAIVRERQETWFEILCEAEMTPEFIASLQRALAARGLYAGQVTGRMDRPTRAAVRTYQKPRGLDSSTISLASARSLGLSPVAPPEE